MRMALPSEWPLLRGEAENMSTSSSLTFEYVLTLSPRLLFSDGLLPETVFDLEDLYNCPCMSEKCEFGPLRAKLESLATPAHIAERQEDANDCEDLSAKLWNGFIKLKQGEDSW